MSGVVPAKGLARMLSNKTPLSKATGKLCFCCPICHTTFLKPAAWAKRTANHYCSRACAYQGSRVRIETMCVVCGKTMEQTPSDADRVKTCSKLCSSLRRRSKHPKKTAFAVYKTAARAVVKRGVCCRCGQTHGPWRVRGLTALTASDGAVSIDSDCAELWCEHCHLKQLAPVAGEANKQRLLKRSQHENWLYKNRDHT